MVTIFKRRTEHIQKIKEEKSRIELEQKNLVPEKVERIEDGVNEENNASKNEGEQAGKKEVNFYKLKKG